MGRRKRKIYSKNFKLSIVIKILDGKKTLNEIVKEYGLPAKKIKTWKKEFLDISSLSFNEEEMKECKQNYKLLKLIIEKNSLREKLEKLKFSNENKIINTIEVILEEELLNKQSENKNNILL